MSAYGGDLFIARDGAYMLASDDYHAFIRVGSVDKLKTTDLAQPPQDSTSVRAFPPTFGSFAVAYGHAFWTESISAYASYSAARDFSARRVQSALSPKDISLGSVSSTPGLVDGCRGGGRTALLFEMEKTKARVVAAEGDGDFTWADVETGDTSPHLTCARDAVIVTSVALQQGKGKGRVVVESRCAAGKCDTRRSDPMPLLPGGEVDAAAMDSGVLMVWKTPGDRVASKARGMVFFRLAPLDALASTPPRPLIENHRHGGVDVDHLDLLPRGPASLLLLRAGKKAAPVYAVRVDAAGAVSAVHVEETKW
jgi:hypothetical protein